MPPSRQQTTVKEIDTARGEAELEELLLTVTWDQRKHWENDCVRDDASGGQERLHLGYPMHISNNPSLESIEKNMVKHGKRSMSPDETYQYKVILAKIYFYNGKFDRCKETISLLPGEVDESSELSPAYMKHMFITMMVIRGIMLEMEGNLASAHRTYDKALTAFRDKLGSQADIVVPRSHGASSANTITSTGTLTSSKEELVNWPEEALYRRAMLSLSLDDESNGLDGLASYLHHLDNVTPPSFRALRRMRANRLYMLTMRTSIKGGTLITPEVKLDIIQSHRRQIALLKSIYGFPRADETREDVLYEIDNAYSDWTLIHADSRTESLCLLEILYETVSLTYNSPRVLRYLMHTLTKFGDYHEARLALNTYLVLVERQMAAFKKMINAAISGGSDNSGANAVDSEDIEDILESVIAGAHLYLIHLSEPHECLSLIHFANDLIDDIEANDPSHAVVHEIPRDIKARLALWKGAVHGKLAQKSREPKNRADHHNAALQLLQHAVEQSPRSYDAHYQLSLELAIGARNISAATVAAKQAVALDPKRLEAWHVLALLSTSRKDYAKAFQICETALKQSEWWSVYTDVQGGNLQASMMEQSRNHLGLDLQQGKSTQTSLSSSAEAVSLPSRPGNVESGIAFFDLALTQMAIISRLRGHDACLKSQPSMFALYGCIYGPVHSYGNDLGDVSSAMDEHHLAIDALTLSAFRTGAGEAPNRHNPAPSQTSGRKSLARSLARSMFSRHSLHTRYFSHGGERPPLPPLVVSSSDRPSATATKSAGTHVDHDTAASSDGDASSNLVEEAANSDSALGRRDSEHLQRQRSMPHLRRSSRDSSIGSHDLTPETYFNALGRSPRRTSSDGLGIGSSLKGGGGSSSTALAMKNGTSVYYTQVQTRISKQRVLAQRALCSLWLATAESYIMLERIGEAGNTVSEALLAWPESPEALTMRGQLELAHKEYLPALNEFHAAVSLESSNIRASVGLARVEYLLGRWDVALGLLKNVTRAHGWSDPEAWYWLGRLEREVALEQVDADSEAAREKLAQLPAMKNALEYMTYALDLESSQPVRPFSILRP
ncbi:hypothetical protein EV178_002767 [Coemansia sp. RSA 1646]|nr:hypothetical protein EV178_002767 [Coemansia sp. RSA 1646]